MGITTREAPRRVPRQTALDLARSRSGRVRTPSDLDFTEGRRGCTPCRGCFYSQFAPAESKEFDALKTVSTYPAATVLYLEEQKTKGIYVLCEGEVKLSVSSHNGKTLLLRIARSGEVLGLLSALTGDSYEATAQTLRPCRLAFVSSSDFQQFVVRHPNLFQFIANQLGSQYRKTCDQLCAVGLGGSMLEKVAHFLLTWSASQGVHEDGVQFTLSLNHEQIGECVGATRESVSRALSEFRIRGLIEHRGAIFVIHNRGALAAVRNRAVRRKDEGAHLVRMRPIRYLDALGIRERFRGQRQRA
jgi:CRP/FNR family transcriptional regulator, cyclic AMP receptor protein